MKDSTYATVCTLMLGLATMLRFSGYDMATFIVESVLHSEHTRSPDRIVAHAGYYGQCLKDIVSCVATLFAPILLNYMHPKWVLVIGSIFFSFYCANFLFIENVTYFLANALLGIGFSISFTAFSTYQMEFSTRENLAKHSARIWGIADLSMAIGGLIYIVMSKFADSSKISEAVKAIESHYRYYTTEEIRLLYAVFTAVSLGCVALCIFLPSRRLPGSIAAVAPQPKIPAREQIAAILSTLVHPSVLMLAPRCLFYGALLSFYLSVYPTALQFSSALAANHPNLTAYYGIAISLGGVFLGIAAGPLNSRIRDFGMRPLMLINLLVNFLFLIIALCTTPEWASIRPTDEWGLLFQPSLLWSLAIGFLIGIADAAQNTSQLVVCSRLLPDRVPHVYSANRFYMGASSAFIFFFAPSLSITAHIFILGSLAILGSIGFHFAVRTIERRDESTGIGYKVKNMESIPV